MARSSITPDGAKAIIPGLVPTYRSLAPVADVIVRVTVGALLMPHGAQKLFGAFGGGGLSGTAQFLAQTGYEPGMLWAVVVACLEFFGGLCLVLGLLTRPIALLVVAFMANAIAHHWPAYFWSNQGLEMPLLWGLMALSVLIKGGGPYSIDARIGREF